jgi:hypothetical protein
MTDSHRVRRITYTSKSQSTRGTEMNTIHLVVAQRMNDRLREADNERLGRLASRRPRRTIASRLAATAAALRPATDDSLDGHVAKRPA